MDPGIRWVHILTHINVNFHIQTTNKQDLTFFNLVASIIYVAADNDESWVVIAW
ncbi:hypothetical protein [Mycoplasmoides gallisepticum]|uniref:hypothetical protein n=1 Tax=Mycoplasmoides gallisepticum TaxID=2096 RepID=UPI003704745F